MTKFPMKQRCRILFVTNAILIMAIMVLCIHYGTFTRILHLTTGKDIEGNPYYYNKSDIYENCPRTDDDIIFIGDSITDRGEFQEYFTGVFVKNRGIEGDTTERIIDRLNTILSVPPGKVFIMVGINDIGDGIDIETFRKNYLLIVTMIRKASSKTEIYIESILPVNYSMMTDNERNSRRTTKAISDYNEILKEIAKSSVGIEYIDIGRLMIDDDGELDRQYTFDGVHLNGTGYKIWTEAVREYVEN